LWHFPCTQGLACLHSSMSWHWRPRSLVRMNINSLITQSQSWFGQGKLISTIFILACNLRDIRIDKILIHLHKRLDFYICEFQLNIRQHLHKQIHLQQGCSHYHKRKHNFQHHLNNDQYHYHNYLSHRPYIHWYQGIFGYCYAVHIQHYMSMNKNHHCYCKSVRNHHCLYIENLGQKIFNKIS